LFAGQVAAKLVDTITEDPDRRKDAVARTWKALTALTEVRP
jgi:hypothetical protein